MRTLSLWFAIFSLLLSPTAFAGRDSVKSGSTAVYYTLMGSYPSGGMGTRLQRGDEEQTAHELSALLRIYVATHFETTYDPSSDYAAMNRVWGICNEGRHNGLWRLFNNWLPDKVMDTFDRRKVRALVLRLILEFTTQLAQRTYDRELRPRTGSVYLRPQILRRIVNALAARWVGAETASAMNERAHAALFREVRRLISISTFPTDSNQELIINEVMLAVAQHWKQKGCADLLVEAPAPAAEGEGGAYRIAAVPAGPLVRALTEEELNEREADAAETVSSGKRRRAVGEGRSP